MFPIFPGTLIPDTNFDKSGVSGGGQTTCTPGANAYGGESLLPRSSSSAVGSRTLGRSTTFGTGTPCTTTNGWTDASCGTCGTCRQPLVHESSKNHGIAKIRMMKTNTISVIASALSELWSVSVWGWGWGDPIEGVTLSPTNVFTCALSMSYNLSNASDVGFHLTLGTGVRFIHGLRWSFSRSGSCHHQSCSTCSSPIGDPSIGPRLTL